MIKLTAKDDWQHAEFYFRDVESCDKFKSVFSNHWCNINWNPIENVPDEYIGQLSDYHRKSLDEDPKKLAESNLKWGFNSYMAEHPELDLTKNQQTIVDKIASDVESSASHRDIFSDEYIKDVNAMYWAEEDELKLGIHPSQVKEKN